MAGSNITKKNVLLIIPSLGIGGAENALSKISLELAKKYNVFICIFNRDIPLSFPYGGQLISLDIQGGTSIKGKALNFWKRIKKIRDLKKQLKIDVAISFLEGADFINILSKGREKVIISIRSSKTHNESIIGHFDFVRNKIFIPFLYKRPDAIVAVQKNIVNELTDVFGIPGEKIVVINNFFDREYILSKASEALEPEYENVFEKPVIIAAGRLTEVKGFNYLLDAFVTATMQKPLAKLVILGDGLLRNELEKQARNSGFSVFTAWGTKTTLLPKDADILFLGHQSNPYKYIKRSAVFAMSSLSEGFPNAMAEAMVCGVPIISTDCPYGPREILAPGTPSVSNLQEAEYATYGILLPEFSKNNTAIVIKVWASTLNNFLANKPKLHKYAEQARLRMENFSKESIIAQWEQVIEQ